MPDDETDLYAFLSAGQHRVISSLAAELEERASLMAGDAQYWIGLAGPPGSGKSTLAEALKERLGNRLTVIPMDGFHYYRSELDAMPDPALAHARRGAPFTFNASKFVDALIKARRSGEGSFPAFDHTAGDPVENAIQLSRATKIVLVEGNYVLLDREPWSRLRIEVFDEKWFLDVPLDVCNRRVYERHLVTGLTEEAARRRVETNDKINGRLILEISPGLADRIIQFTG